MAALVALALGWYMTLVAGKIGIHAGSADSSGYLNNTKLILEGRLHAEQRRLDHLETTDLSPYAFVPLGFRPFGESGMVPTYALGLSALYAASAWAVPLETGTFALTWLMVLGCLVATYRLARQLGLERGWALAGPAVLAACPLFQYMAVQAMSDMPSLLWTTLALTLAWDSRRRPGLAVLAGGAVSVAVFLRPSNALVLPALGFALGSDWRRWLRLGAGGLPGGLAWLATNHVLYGHLVATGYGDVSRSFQWANAPRSLQNYAEWLPVLLPILPAVLLAWGGPKPTRRPALMAATWALACVGFYTFYYHTFETWWYLRFILPAFPALIVLALLGLRRATRAIGGRPGPARLWWRPVCAGALLAAVGVASLRIQVRTSRRLEAFGIGAGESVYPLTCAWLRERIPDNALIVGMQMTGALTFYNRQPFLRWDETTKPQSQRIFAAAARAGRPVYAVLFPFELEETFRDHVAGKWAQIGSVRQVTIWRLEEAGGATP